MIVTATSQAGRVAVKGITTYGTARIAAIHQSIDRNRGLSPSRSRARSRSMARRVTRPRCSPAASASSTTALSSSESRS